MTCRLEGGSATMGRRVLIAHPEPAARAWLCRQLAACGLRVVAQETNGLSLVGSARELRPDGVFLHANLPHLDGWSAARHLRRHLPDCCLCLIAPSEAADQDRLATSGIDAYLPDADWASAPPLRQRLRWLVPPPALLAPSTD